MALLLRREIGRGVRACCVGVLLVALVACGKTQGDTGQKVIINVTPGPPTATTVPRMFTQVPPAQPTSTPVAFSANSPTITNVLSNRLTSGVKARVKDSADGLSLRAMPSTSAGVIETLAAGTQLSVLADPTTADGREWVKVSHGNNQGFVAAEFVERI